MSTAPYYDARPHLFTPLAVHKPPQAKPRQAFATRAIHAGHEPDPTTGAVMTPIYTTSTFVQSSPGVHKGFDYGRSHNPTRFALERCVADLEEGTAGFAFASGLAAIATVLELLDHGSHVLVCDDIYGGSYRLFERVRRRSANLDFSYVDPSNIANFRAGIRPNTRLIWIETPSNPLLKLADLAAIAEVGKARGILCVADNTFATPFVQQPLTLGFDVVVHSVTKYLNGHSDMIGGIAVVGDGKISSSRCASCRTRSAASADRSTVSWRCAESRRWPCACSGTATMPSRLPTGWPRGPTSNGFIIPACRAIHSTLLPDVKCVISAAWFPSCFKAANNEHDDFWSGVNCSRWPKVWGAWKASSNIRA